MPRTKVALVILAFDTATRTTTGALLNNGQCLATFSLDGSNPGDSLAVEIDRLFKQTARERADLHRIFIGVGPGPFTSTRVGIAVARSIGLGLGIDVVGVCTHDAIAAEFAASESDTFAFIVATDARRSEVYWARYENGVRVVGPTVDRPEVVVADQPDVPWIGNGLVRYPELTESVVRSVAAVPSGEWIGRVGSKALEAGCVPATGLTLTEHAQPAQPAQYVGHELFEPRPLYLRRPDAVPAVK